MKNLCLFIVIFAAYVLVLAIPGLNKPETVNPEKLLDTVAKGESKGNYNAYFGNADNKALDFTAMPVNQVLAWQREYVKEGSPSSAVGKYQFIRPTLDGLVNELGISKEARFDKQLQDRLAVRLLERRGLKQYMNGEITIKQFAHNLSKEWAALPKVIGKNPNASYYAGDGLNKVQVSKAEIYSGIATLHN